MNYKQLNNLQADDTVALLIENMRRQSELCEQVLSGLPVQRNLQNRSKVLNNRKYLKFTKKEISRMPTAYKNIFATNDMIVHYRLKPDGVYEARFHRKGINIEVSSKDLTKLKQKFIDKLNNKTYEEPKPKKPEKVVKTFTEYAEEWLKLKKVTTKPSTYGEYVRMLNRDILPVFGSLPVTEIDRNSLQNFLLTYVERGVLRTAHKLFLLLRCIFDMVAEDYSISSPMKKVVVPSYESKQGCAFTYEEEKQLVNYCLANLERDTSHALLVLLYTGLRRSELASLNLIDGTWLECETSKEKKGRNVVKRKIPLTPMMKRVLPYIDFEKAKNVNLNSLHTAMKRLFANHHSHELRHTFISRCKESGVPAELVSIWAGHSLSGTITTTVYTHYSEDFQLKEAQKVDYLQWEFGT
ncbi:MAG: tyrosine-type recombinase/integrase [Candidatus Coproplasma sp.]